MEMEMEEEGSSSKAEERNSCSYDCNICLEVAEEEPVVTLCGHLFCCACIYRWLHLHSQSQQCPVCKAYLPKLIPLSSRQQSSSSSQYCPQQNTFAPIVLEDLSGHRSFTTANISAASGLFSLLLLGFHDGFAHHANRRINERARHEQENFVCSRLFDFLACFVFVCLISF